MSEPIISPWLIYLIEASSTIKTVLFGLFIVFCVATLVHFLISIEEIDLDLSDTDLARHKKAAIRWVVIAIITALIAAFVPTKETCYKLLIANYTTYENVDKLGDGAKDTVDYVFDKIEEVQNGSTESEGE